ncbi:MAG: 50S ribosomal protein L10 [Alphaproteobacteria bacterium]
MQRTEKEQLVASLNRAFTEATAVVITRQSGLSVSEISDLRRKVRAVGGRFKVAKNRLARRALSGTKYEGLADLLTGPTAIAFSSDPVAVAKVAVDFSRTNEKLVIAGGALGVRVLNPEGVKALATLPSLDELRGKIAGLLKAPQTKVAGVLQAPAGMLARLLQAYARQGEARPGEAA